MEESQHREVPAEDVGGTLLAALREDGQFGRWTLDRVDGRVLEPLLAAAVDHRVGPVVRRALAARGIPTRTAAAGEAPPSGLDAGSMSAVAQHLRVTAELGRISPVLDAVGVPWIVFKGPVLSELAYGHPELRHYSDLDVLVHPGGFGAAAAALEEHGAVLLDQNWSFLRRRGYCEASFLLPHGTLLDLHWHLVNNARARSAFRWSAEASLERRRRVIVGGVATTTLDPEDTLLHVALHAAISGGHQLSWVKDVERVVALGADWDEVVRRARAARVAVPVGAMLRRAERLLGARVPGPVLDALARPRPTAYLLRLGERLATPARIAGHHHTGQLLFLTARSGLASTAAALAVELRLKVDRARHGPHGPLSAAGTGLPDPDPLGRLRYLDDLATRGDVSPFAARGGRVARTP